MGQGIRGIICLGACAFALPVVAQAPASPTCFDHRPLTKASPKSAWDDIANREVPASLALPPITQVQRVKDGAGNTNRDFYQVRFKAAPGQTAASVFQDLRTNLRERIFRNQLVGNFRGYDRKNEEKWKSSDPLGAVMTFVMMDTPGVKTPDTPLFPLPDIPGTEWEKGSVVLSCISETDFIFSTVTTPADGVHPVSGSRGFAVSLDADGHIRIMTKAVDRVVDHGAYQAGAALIFRGGDRIWKAMLKNLTDHYKAQEPSAFNFRKE
jgi:hypothetical protein